MTDLALGVVAGGTASEIAAREALPVQSIWAGGHVASPNGSPEAMVGLARLASLTDRVRIGTSILLLPLYPPAIVAKQIADLDRATTGRVTLGVGIGGEYPVEFRACQSPRSERGARTDEAISLLRKLWSGEPVTHRGRYYSMEDVLILPAPVQAGGPPIVVAGRREPAMRRAARLGDGWMPYLYSARRYASSVETVSALAREAGRDLTNFEWYAFVFVAVNRDGERAREHATRFLGGMYNQDFPAMLPSIAAVGTPEEVTCSLQAFVDAGARHLIMAPATADRDGTLARLFDDVIPELHVRA